MSRARLVVCCSKRLVRRRRSSWRLCAGGWEEVGVWMQEEKTEEYDKAAEVQAEVKVEAEVERRQKARRSGAHGAERECGGDRV